jgi:hypothetical protein
MLTFKRLLNTSGLAVLLSTFIVFIYSVERTGSLWDCGEFILGAYKLQVVHPPGAGLFVLIGRMFTLLPEWFSDNPANIAFAVNLMSGLCTSLAAMMIAWTTMLIGKMAIVGRDEEPSSGESMALALGGLAAGLATAFSTSIWFSAVEGEVYAMSTFFTALTLWAAVKWYHLPKEPDADRWLIFSIFAAGLSVGVHLLSLLTFPAIALLYYFKKYKSHSLLGAFISLGIGLLGIAFIQKLVIVGIPALWKNMELMMVNGMGFGFHTGLIPTILIIAAVIYLLFLYARKNNNALLQNITMAATLVVIAYSSVGVVVIRANADTPVNMNVPSDAMRLIPYLNREQYGERPLLRGPHYKADPVGMNREDRYGRVGDRYDVVDEKFDYKWKDSDMMLFPRIGHQDRVELHEAYREYLTGKSGGNPGMGYNLSFMWNYQMNWMYWRYFMWNFAGRQNGEQGVFIWDPKDGNWLSGIGFIDNTRLYNQKQIPDAIKHNQARNTYYLLPLLFGLLGLVFHFFRGRKEFYSLAILFLLTGLGIIIFSNQPPQEPRERDYVLVGSFMTFCIWIGLGTLALYKILEEKVSFKGLPAAILVGILVLIAPVIMGFQNFDDHCRRHHTASRDYASNFLNSVEPNAIIFTYGDNDTYPLWYAQEVENIRRDVRVVNLSLIAVDWYINKLRSKVNESAPINLTIPAESYRGKINNQVYFDTRSDRPVSVLDALKYVGDLANHTQQGVAVLPSTNLIIPIDIEKSTVFDEIKRDSLPTANFIQVNLAENTRYITKDELAILDVIASNIHERPIYYAVTCRNEKLLGMNEFMQLEGLALRIVPVRSRGERGFGIYGSGRVHNESFYENVMNKWKWGNFDNKELFVDKSYMAQVQSMKFTILRAAMDAQRKSKTQQAADLVNKYFESFPNFNFRYDLGIMPFVNILAELKEYESAKKHLRILAEETKQNKLFYESLKPSELQHFKREIDFNSQASDEILQMCLMMGDADFLEEMETLLGEEAANEEIMPQFELN